MREFVIHSSHEAVRHGQSRPNLSRPECCRFAVHNMRLAFRGGCPDVSLFLTEVLPRVALPRSHAPGGVDDAVPKLLREPHHGFVEADPSLKARALTTGSDTLRAKVGADGGTTASATRCRWVPMPRCEADQDAADVSRDGLPHAQRSEETRR